MPNRSEYQPLSQSADDEHDETDFHHDVDLPQPQPQPRASRRTRRLRAPKPVAIDLSKLDAAFKRLSYIQVIFSTSYANARTISLDGPKV